jgi:formylglycine-generating enzyme required for sulfatase activity
MTIFMLLSLQAQNESTRGIAVVARDKTGSQKEVKLYRQTHAIVIGIDKYPNLPPDKQLVYAVKDAKGVAETISNFYIFNTIITLYNEQATRDKILETFNKLAETSTEDDAVFVFFAGHGYTEKTKHGEIGYLIPSDGSLDKLHCNISMTTIREDVSKKIPAKHIFYVIDACYGGLLLSRGESKKSQRNLEYLQEITKEDVRQVLTAGDKNQTVLDGGPKGHSVFTGRFIQALEEATDFITAREISQSVKEKVFSDARTRNHTQTPKDGELFGLGDFVFVPNKGRLDNLAKSRREQLLIMEKAEAEMKAKSDAEAAEIKKREQEIKELENKIAALQKKMGASGQGDASTLDQIVAVVEQKERQAKELAQMRQRAEEERRQREAEIARLKAEEQQKQYDALQADITKYNKVAQSEYGKDLKENAWNALLEKWGLQKGSVPTGNISALCKMLNLAPPSSEGFIALGKNQQGYEEYRHEATGMVFVLIPAGTFKIGSNDGEANEKPVHEVTVNSFLISKYETTQGAWQKIMSSNPSNFTKGNDYPVEQVSWDNCQEFCKKAGLRLPTEAEWEYVCRAGTNTKYYWGDKEDGDYMWFGEKWEGGHHQVGQKKPNGFGLYDMSGNVWEWCSDWYDGNYYQNSPKDNPKGPASGQYRVLRGGSWYNGADGCRSASRHWHEPANRFYFLGMRCVALK